MKWAILIFGLLALLLFATSCVPLSYVHEYTLQVVKMEYTNPGYPVIQLTLSNGEWKNNNVLILTGVYDTKGNLDVLGVSIGKYVKVRCLADMFGEEHQETCRILSVSDKP